MTLNVLADYKLLFNDGICDKDHSIEKIERMFAWWSTNSLLSNFIRGEIILQVTN